MSDIKIKELTEKLLIQWLDKLSYLSDFNRKKIYNMGCNYYNNVSDLFEINKVIVNEGRFYKDEINNAIYEREEDKHIFDLQR